MILRIYVDEPTRKRLDKASTELGRAVEELAESAVAGEVLGYFRHREDDPGREERPHG